MLALGEKPDSSPNSCFLGAISEVFTHVRKKRSSMGSAGSSVLVNPSSLVFPPQTSPRTSLVGMLLVLGGGTRWRRTAAFPFGPRRDLPPPALLPPPFGLVAV